jgi:hypothetical protein
MIYLVMFATLAAYWAANFSTSVWSHAYSTCIHNQISPSLDSEVRASGFGYADQFISATRAPLTGTFAFLHAMKQN